MSIILDLDNSYSKDGWYTEVPSTVEHVLVRPTAVAGLVLFTTFAPSISSACKTLQLVIHIGLGSGGGKGDGLHPKVDGRHDQDQFRGARMALTSRHLTWSNRRDQGLSW